MTQLSEEQQPELTIRTGGEDLSIFEIMQRYRNDGSCEYVIQDALRRLSLLDSDSQLESEKQQQRSIPKWTTRHDWHSKQITIP